MRATEAQFEVVGDGVLVTFGQGGASLFFESKADAEHFGRNLMMTAAIGGDVIDEELQELEELEEGSSDA